MCHREDSARALPSRNEESCNQSLVGSIARRKVVQKAQLIFGPFLLFSTRSHHVSQRADGSIRGCGLRLQYSSRRRADRHDRYCDSRAYHLVIQLSLERRWRPWLLRILLVEVGNEVFTVGRQRSMVAVRYPGIRLRAIACNKDLRGDSTMVLSTLKQKEERSSRRLGQSLANTEIHKRKSQVQPNRLRSSHPRCPTASNIVQGGQACRLLQEDCRVCAVYGEDMRVAGRC